MFFSHQLSGVQQEMGNDDSILKAYLLCIGCNYIYCDDIDFRQIEQYFEWNLFIAN